jgi:hypothetical protein
MQKGRQSIKEGLIIPAQFRCSQSLVVIISIIRRHSNQLMPVSFQLPMEARYLISHRLKKSPFTI